MKTAYRKTVEHRIFGPPGTGKTTTLGRLVGQACKEVGSDVVIAASFTRTAARELTTRNLPIADDHIGTLHSLCYRALDRPKLVDKDALKLWNDQYPEWRFDGVGRKDLDDPWVDAGDEGAGLGDELLQAVNLQRGLREHWDGRTGALSVVNFYQAWCDFKSTMHLVDFTDLIEGALSTDVPFDARVMFLDEVQDFSPLELALARHWGAQCEHVWLAGDDDQASLPGTQVMVEGGGVVSVEALNPSIHRLVSYDFRGSQLNGLRRGHSFEIQPSNYEGFAYEVRSAGRETRTTDNHPWVARWTDDAKNKTIVYLMRKGRSFRVGWCQLMRSDGICHLHARARIEGADAAWILKVCESRLEASLYESYISAHYGISTVIWRPMHDQSRGHYTKDVIEKLFHMLGDQYEQASLCLREFNRRIEYPFYERGKLNRGGARSFLTAACNLEPQIMAVPVVMRPGDDGVEWQAIKNISCTPYVGTVYGLSVPPHRSYVADGIVTHNCLYSFKGAIPDVFLTPAIPDEQVMVLGQSYRVPKAVHAAAMAWVSGMSRRKEKRYAPRDFDGTVDVLPVTYKYPDPLQEFLDEWVFKQGKTVALLTTCSFHLEGLKRALRAWGMPFHNPYRTRRGDWNPLLAKSGTVSSADRLMAFRKVADGRGWWTYEELWRWAAVLEAKEVFAHKAKTEMRRKAEDNPTGEVLVTDLEKWIPEASISEAVGKGDPLWFLNHCLTEYERSLEYAGTILNVHGASALTERPKIIVGTIHSVKGGEADYVVLFPDLSPAAYDEWCTPGEPHDAVRRTIYVGMTRAREALYWAQPAGLSVDGYL